MDDLKRVRFVTQNYHNLQGIRWIVWGCLCLLVAAEDAGRFPTLLLAVAVIPAAVLLVVWSGLYYQRRFGQVKGPHSETQEPIMLWGVALPITAVVSFLVDRTVDLPFFLAPFVYGAGLIWLYRQSEKPFRRHYLYIGLGVIGSNLAYALLNTPPDSPWSRAGVVLWTFIGLSLIVGGFLDHLLLAKTFKPVPEELT